MPRQRIDICAAALALALACAGCGSYTKQDYVARADAICANALRATRSIAVRASPSASAQDPSVLAAYLQAALPVIQTEAQQLQRLRRPDDNARDRAVLSHYLRAVVRDASAYRRLATAAEHNDPQGIANAQAALRTSPVASLASEYGLHTCGTSGATVG